MQPMQPMHPSMHPSLLPPAHQARTRWGAASSSDSVGGWQWWQWVAAVAVAVAVAVVVVVLPQGSNPSHYLPSPSPHQRRRIEADRGRMGPSAPARPEQQRGREQGGNVVARPEPCFPRAWLRLRQRTRAGQGPCFPLAFLLLLLLAAAAAAAAAGAGAAALVFVVVFVLLLPRGAAMTESGGRGHGGRHPRPGLQGLVVSKS